jgi:hypothetical protein
MKIGFVLLVAALLASSGLLALQPAQAVPNGCNPQVRTC